MAISKCVSLSTQNHIDKSLSDTIFHVNETGLHGTVEFPIAVYLDDVSTEYVNWHWHEEFEVGFVTKGSVVLGAGNRKYELACGDLFFINSNVLHSMHKNNSTKQAVFKSIAFHSSIISENVTSVIYTKYLLPILLDNIFKECVIQKDSLFYPEIMDILSKVWDLIYTEAPDYEILVRNELSGLFCLLNRLKDNKKETIPTKMPNYLPEKRVQTILDYIHTHYKDKITIEALSKDASISKTEVLRCFKAIMGMSPIQYLNHYRLQSAAYMLVNTEKNVQEIAEECGFDDNSYFSKLFKKLYCATPCNYRLQSQNSFIAE